MAGIRPEGNNTASLEVKTVLNPNLGVFLAVLAVSSASVLIKLLASQVSALTVISYRIGLTWLILLPLALWKNGKEFKTLAKREFLYAMASGVFLALHFITWTSSLYYTTVASSTVLVDTQPIFVMLGSGLLLREWVGWKKGVCALVAISGTVLIGYQDFHIAGPAFRGDALALAGAVAVTGYWLLGRHLRERLSLLPYVILVYGSCEVVVLAVTLGTGTSLSPGSAHGLGLLLLLAVIPTIFGHTLLNWSLKYVKTPVVAVSLLGEPVGASLLAVLILQEIPSQGQLIGGLIILLGIYLYNRVE